MLAALIPPRGLENYALASGIHLALAIPSLLKHAPYVGLYRRAKRLGNYVILDNGLAEGQAASPSYLLEVAKDLSVDEIVAPDMMTDTKGTLTGVRSFLSRHEAAINGFNVMAVAQGRSMQEFRRCTKAYSDMPAITTLGVPRHMLTTLNSRSARIDFVQWLVKEEYTERFKIHLLGTNAWWTGETRAVAKYLGDVVRSIDSSLPFNYALADVYLNANFPNPARIDRPHLYFERDWNTHCNLAKVKFNVGVFLSWASYKDLED
jgi:hypothetical protein